MPQRSPSPWPAHVALAALLLALCLASLLIWQQLLSAQQQRIAERVSYQAHSLARQLEASLIYQVDDLQRLAQAWNHRGRIPKDEWTLDSQFSLSHFKGYQAIQWLGSDLAMRWVEPLQGNEAAQQFRLTPAHPNFNLAMQAKASGEPRFSNSFALVQGGHGFILYTPLEAGQPIYRRTPGPTVENLQQVVALQLLNNSNFALRLKPSEHLVQRLSTPLPEFVLGASLIISLLLVAALALALENARRAQALHTSNRQLNEQVSQREQIERVLRDSRERLQLVLDLTDSSRDGLFIIDPQTRDILHMNQAMYSSLGYSAETFSQLLKEDPEQLLPGFHQWLEGVRQAQQDKLSQIFQRQMRRRDGSLQAAEISAQLMFLNGHEYLIGVSRDNNERLQIEAQLQRLSQQDGLTGLYNRRYFDNRLEIGR